MRCQTFSTRLVVPWRDQALVQRLRSRLEARAGLPRHRPLLLRPLRGRAAQARLAVPLRGEPSVEHDGRLGRRVQGRRHGLQRAALGDVAGQDPGAAHEAAGVQHQAQRERRTVVALLPGMAAAGQRLPVRAALAARAGPVVQGDAGLQVEQVGGALEETRLDRVAVAQQAVAGALQGVPAHGLAVAAEQLAQGAALAQPVPRGTLGGRRGHAADEAAEDGDALRTGQAQLLEQGRRTELPHGPQGDVLDADRARADQLQAADDDPRQGGRRAHGGDAGLHQLGGAALGLVLDRGAAGPRIEGALGGGGARMRSTRAHSAGQSPRGRATWRPRLRRVRWRTLEPQRTERTRRWVKWGSWPLARGRVGVRRTNRLRWEQALGRESGNCKLLWHCIGGFTRLAMENQRLAAQNTPNSARIAPRLANLGQEAVVELFDARQDMPALIGKVD